MKSGSCQSLSNSFIFADFIVNQILIRIEIEDPLTISRSRSNCRSFLQKQLAIAVGFSASVEPRHNRLYSTSPLKMSPPMGKPHHDAPFRQFGQTMAILIDLELQSGGVSLWYVVRPFFARSFGGVRCSSVVSGWLWKLLVGWVPCYLGLFWSGVSE